MDFNLIFYGYTQLEFLGDKIDKDIKYSLSASPERLFPNRFVGAILDLKTLSKDPVIGTGLVPKEYNTSQMKMD